MGKVLIYAMQEGLGGVEQYVLNLSKFCDNPKDKYGYIIIGKKTIYENILKQCGVDYFFITHKNVSVFQNIMEFNRLLKEKRSEYDTLYFNTSGLYYPIPYILAKKYGYKIVLHSHLTSGEWPKKIFHYINRECISHFAAVRLACSTPAGRWLYGKKSFTVVPNAIEMDRFKFNEKIRRYLRGKYGIADRTVIGHIGRLTELKNQIFLIDIFSEYHERYPESILMLVGDGEDRGKLEAKVKSLDMKNEVIFVGRTEKPEDYLSVMDCFVMPSLAEGFPITLVEAQANGLPCVVADTITDEVNISGKIKFCSLDSEPSIWAKLIDKNSKRYDCYEELEVAGYNVSNLEERVYSLIQS